MLRVHAVRPENGAGVEDTAKGSSVMSSDLLEVVLDRGLAAQLGVVRVASDAARCPPSAEQVPVAIELDLEVGEPAAFLLAGATARLELPEAMLLCDELFDVCMDVVGH
jgi:hypothetical protein